MANGIGGDAPDRPGEASADEASTDDLLAGIVKIIGREGIHSNLLYELFDRLDTALRHGADLPADWQRGRA
jgi:hypothetical protein